MSIRNRLDELERATSHDPCEACGGGKLPVIAPHYPGEPEPTPPAPCAACGRPRLLIVLDYVDAEPLEVL
jgi:hypothetical protein